MHKKSGTRAGGAARVRKLAVDVAATWSTLVKVQAVLVEAVRVGVVYEPYKVRTVRVAEMSHTVAEAAYASARGDVDRRIAGYDAALILLPSKSRDNLKYHACESE